MSRCPYVVARRTDGRISGTAPKNDNTKGAAQAAMLAHIERTLHPDGVPRKEELPTFHEWFNGRFWREWVVGRKNKPTEQRSKKIIYECHLKDFFGSLPLDQIRVSEVAQCRAKLVDRELSESASTTSSWCCRRRCATRTTAS
jgi:hypothetical protein